MNSETLEKKIKDRSRFKFDDIFGRARIRKTMYEYDSMKRNKDAEIARLKDICSTQADAITRLVLKVSELERGQEVKS